MRPMARGVMVQKYDGSVRNTVLTSWFGMNICSGLLNKLLFL